MLEGESDRKTKLDIVTHKMGKYKNNAYCIFLPILKICVYWMIWNICKRAGHCSMPFIYNKSSNAHNSMRGILVLFPFYPRKSWGTVRLINWPKVTQVKEGEPVLRAGSVVPGSMLLAAKLHHLFLEGRQLIFTKCLLHTKHYVQYFCIHCTTQFSQLLKEILSFQLF